MNKLDLRICVWDMDGLRLNIMGTELLRKLMALKVRNQFKGAARLLSRFVTSTLRTALFSAEQPEFRKLCEQVV